jgi:hypothetical protein
MVLHLSAHSIRGGPGGVGLVLEDASGHSHILWREDLEELLGMREQALRNISLLFLSTCYSEALAEVFVECGCRHVVAVRNQVLDTAARRFSQQFYLSLALNQSLLDAWEGARRALRIEPEKELGAQADFFVLFGQHGADRATLSTLCGVEAQSPADAFQTRDFESAVNFSRAKLPPRAENFVGRSAWLWELMVTFAGPGRREKKRACAIHGPQGIGKTALGAEFANFAAAPGRLFSSSVLTVRIETSDLEGILNSLEEQLENLSQHLHVPLRTLSGTSRTSFTSSKSQFDDSRPGSACSSSVCSESHQSLDFMREDPLSFLLPAQARVRRALQSMERFRGRAAKTLLLIDDEADVISSSSEARKMIGDLLEHTSQLYVLVLSHEPIYKTLGNVKVGNIRLDGLDLKEASMLFCQRIHRPLEESDFVAGSEVLQPPGPGPGGTGGRGRPQRPDMQQLYGKLSSHRLMQRLAGHPGHIRAVSSRVVPGGPDLLTLAAAPDLLDLCASPTVRTVGQSGEPSFQMHVG